MVYPSKPLVTCLLILCGIFALAFGLVPTPFVVRKTFLLDTVRVVTLNPGEIHRHLASLKRGDFLRVAIDQDPVKKKEIDVSIRVLSPRGAWISDIDSPNGTVGPEEV